MVTDKAEGYPAENIWFGYIIFENIIDVLLSFQNTYDKNLAVPSITLETQKRFTTNKYTFECFS